MMRFLARMLCRHPHRLKVQDARQVLYLECEHCGDRVPAVTRSAKERKQMVALRRRLRSAGRAPVEDIRSRRTGTR